VCCVCVCVCLYVYTRVCLDSCRCVEVCMRVYACVCVLCVRCLIAVCVRACACRHAEIGLRKIKRGSLVDSMN